MGICDGCLWPFVRCFAFVTHECLNHVFNFCFSFKWFLLHMNRPTIYRMKWNNDSLQLTHESDIDNDFLSWACFGPTRLIHRWTTLVHAILRVSDVKDKWYTDQPKKKAIFSRSLREQKFSNANFRGENSATFRVSSRRPFFFLRATLRETSRRHSANFRRVSPRNIAQILREKSWSHFKKR